MTGAEWMCGIDSGKSPKPSWTSLWQAARVCMPFIPFKTHRKTSRPTTPHSRTSMAQAEYRQLGKSGLRVSVPVLGGMSFGSEKWFDWILPEEKALPVLKAAWDAGINTIDTANMYSNGESERIIGKFIKQYNIPRRNLVILTKCRFLVDEDDPSVITSYFKPELAGTREYVNRGGLSRTALFNQVDASLERLQTDYIDLLQIHAFDPDTPMDETMKALHDLVQSGKVRYIGACNLRAWQFIEMNHIAEKNCWTQFVCTQVEHSLLYRPEEREMFAYCEYKGIGILAYSPLMDGFLARPLGTKTKRTAAHRGTVFEKPMRKSDETIISRVEELSKKLGWKMSQVALAWSLTKVSSPIVGANSRERIQEAIIVGKTLSDEQVKYLEEPYEIRPPRF
ncbi:Versiconal hemiacetal acetate reductase [Grifola frondosa]|uniref:Versiconal hemiacetal acetate reductase n=1 Tax=Grifola frondosa TaxID=5627 RepID=A0A1C7MEC4_GRIFR|nr:Versiconal hemiacetal acetate reductase [Grifola frondosa]